MASEVGLRDYFQRQFLTTPLFAGNKNGDKIEKLVYVLCNKKMHSDA